MPQTVLLRGQCDLRSSMRAKRGMPQAIKRGWVGARGRRLAVIIKLSRLQQRMFLARTIGAVLLRALVLLPPLGSKPEPIMATYDVFVSYSHCDSGQDG
jgi:hypothetical protein